MKHKVMHLLELLGEIQDIRLAAEFLEWDQHTYMPSGAADSKARQISTLKKTAHSLFVSDEMGELLEDLEFHKDQLENWEQDVLRVTIRDYKRQRKIPSSLVEKLSAAASGGLEMWLKAREENDFSLFENALDTIFKLNGDLAAAVGYRESPYDALLDEFEPEMTAAGLEKPFYRIKNKLSEYLSSVKNQLPPADQHLLQWPVENQKKLNRWLVEKLGFDFTHGRMDTSVHPFTMAFTRDDVRITTKYNPDDFTSGLMGTIHETGHALYEQHLPEKFKRSPLGQAASIGFHESQSRFYENIIGRSRAFWKFLSPHLHGFYPEVGQNDLSNTLFVHVNKVHPSLIRIEADEITYNLHIIIRFELEKGLLEGDIKIKDVPELWNEKYAANLGVRPSDLKSGVLQDIHWAIGLIGYFPTYTLGNIISAQLLEQLQRQLPNYLEQIEMGNFNEINMWLKKNVHEQGKRKSPAQLLQCVTGENLNVKPLLDYYKGKLTQLSKI